MKQSELDGIETQQIDYELHLRGVLMIYIES